MLLQKLLRNYEAISPLLLGEKGPGDEGNAEFQANFQDLCPNLPRQEAIAKDLLNCVGA